MNNQERTKSVETVPLWVRLDDAAPQHQNKPISAHSINNIQIIVYWNVSTRVGRCVNKNSLAHCPKNNLKLSIKNKSISAHSINNIQIIFYWNVSTRVGRCVFTNSLAHCPKNNLKLSIKTSHSCMERDVSVIRFLEQGQAWFLCKDSDCFWDSEGEFFLHKNLYNYALFYYHLTGIMYSCNT